MSQKYYFANAVLWATAILVAAACGAPVYFSTVLLPLLAGGALLLTRPQAGRCGAK